MSEGQTWTVEVESDCFTEDDGLIVSLCVEEVDPQENDGEPVAVIAQLSPQQAREIAAELMKVADHVERSVLTPRGWVAR